MHTKGTLYWITGLSGAGKTTKGTLLYNYINSKKDNVVIMDGDVLREIYQNKDYSQEGREKLSYINCRLFKTLTDQGIDVIAPVIGMKHAYREWNRNNIENYCEIYLDVPMEVLIARDSKGLYSKALRKELTNVYGIDMPFEAPSNPELRIVNDSTHTPEEVCNTIIQALDLY